MPACRCSAAVMASNDIAHPECGKHMHVTIDAHLLWLHDEISDNLSTQHDAPLCSKLDTAAALAAQELITGSVPTHINWKLTIDV